MNAKFEKWWKDEKHGQYFAGHMRRDAARKGWNGAIQSLEVTPELRTIAEEAFRSSDGESWSGWLNDALNAFLSALKEQAK